MGELVWFGWLAGCLRWVGDYVCGAVWKGLLLDMDGVAYLLNYLLARLLV